jgi:hypothetical protein
VFNFWAGALFEYEKGRRSNWKNQQTDALIFVYKYLWNTAPFLMGKKGTGCAFHSKPANQGVRVL